jgi:hypothetical protein
MTESDAKDDVAPREISRREFIERTMIGGVAAGIGSGASPLRLAASMRDAAHSRVELKVVGNDAEGYGVTMLHGGQALARHNGGGEFSAVFQNGERSLEDRVENWKASSWKGDETRVTLEGTCQLKNMNTKVQAQVEYEVVGAGVVRKRIRLRQADMFLLFQQVSNRLEPSEPPAKFWSFDQPDCKGGALREYFPAGGFRTKDGVCVGLLTDSGYRNQWSRIIRRDGRPVKPAARKIPDANLYEVSSGAEREKGHFFVQQTFGEALVQTGDDNAADMVSLPPISSWVKTGAASLEEVNGAAVISTANSADGILIPITAAGGAVYSLRLEYRSAQPIAAEIWDVDEQQRKLREITLYNDRIPESPNAWSKFETAIFAPGWTGSGGVIFLSLPPSEQATERGTVREARRFEVRGLAMKRMATTREPYHRLEMGHAIEKTVFIFVDEGVPDTMRGYRLASQCHLAEGLGFRGGDTEKVLYADLMMLCWNADTEEARPMLAPSIWYSAAGEMYLRDSFYALNGAHNRELNEGVFNVWAENQGEDGAINTLVEPNMANLERKSNDSTPLWLMWALVNRRRFGTKPPMEKVRRAAEYCLRTYDPHGDGSCFARFVMGQLDVISYPQGTTTLCENQGVLAVTLRAIKELQITGVSERISEEHIQEAENNYRSYYDPARKFLRPARDIGDAIGFAEIFPEFLSLWLFGRKMLTDEMVTNHLDRIPVLLPRANAPHPEEGGTVRPILIGLPEGGKRWSFFNEKWHPMVSDSFAADYARGGMDGVYYNGGSWMRIEICGYVAGMLHGWSRAKKAIANRLWAEINISPDYPTSQEYLATEPAYPFFGYHRVFAWNSFVLQALEFAGLRGKEMDPDFGRSA